MTRTRGDARAWLAWALAGGAVATASRNPLVLGLLLLVVAAVGLRLLPGSTIGRSWRRAGRLVLWLAALSVLFNLLTVRAGDTPLARLPADWPVVGGALTLNALVHGLLAALSMLTILAVWAVFNGVVSQGDLLSLTPRPLYLAGAVGSIALTFLPGMARAVEQIGEAQAVRGHRPRGPRDLAPLAVPLLNLGLERGLSLAEAMEARGFGNGSGRVDAAGASAADPGQRWLLPGVVLLAGGALAALGSPWPLLGAGLLALGAALTWRGLRGTGPGRTRYRRRRWSWGDTAVTAAAAATVALLVAARLAGDADLSYVAYPALRPPGVSWLGIAATLPLLAPVVCAEAGWR
jgi:energy-coupling factor transport system permease protein